MSFNVRLEPVWDVFASFEGLVTNVFNHIEPLIQLYLLFGVVVAQRLDHNFNKLIHKNWKDRHSHDLNNYTHDFLADRRWEVISLTDSGQGREHEVHESHNVVHHVSNVFLMLRKLAKSIHEVIGS